MNDYTIRDATPDDLSEMAAMASDLVRFHYEIDPLRYLMPRNVEAGYRSWFQQEFDNPKAFLLVAEPAEDPAPIRLAGYAYGRIEERDWNLLLAEHAALHDILVRPEARRSGVGQALIRAFCARARARRAPRVVLHTAYTNTAAQALFKQEGFRPTMVEMTRELTDDHDL